MYVRGDKTVPGTPFYQNIDAFWVRNDMVGVNITSCLAPQHQWPADAQDVAPPSSGCVTTSVPTAVIRTGSCSWAIRQAHPISRPTCSTNTYG